MKELQKSVHICDLPVVNKHQVVYVYFSWDSHTFCPMSFIPASISLYTMALLIHHLPSILALLLACSRQSL